MKPALAVAVVLAVAAPVLIAAAQGPQAWQGCCGIAPWPPAGPMNVQPRASAGPLFQGYNYIVGGSPLRHHLGLTGQIPAAYAKLQNPLPATAQNAQRGASVYDVNCASCHGATGLGDGPASKTANPPPAELGWLLRIPPAQRDAFMYWSIVDGGAKFHTAMPAFKGRLSDHDTWAVIGYIDARLPKTKPPAKKAG